MVSALRSGWTRAGGTLTDRRELGAPTAGRGGEVGEASRGRTYHRGEGRSPAGSWARWSRPLACPRTGYTLVQAPFSVSLRSLRSRTLCLP